jgi:hypothetical protein
MKTKKQKKQNPKTCCVHTIKVTYCSITLVLWIWKSITFSNQQEQLGYQNIVSTNLRQDYVWKLGYPCCQVWYHQREINIEPNFCGFPLKYCLVPTKLASLQTFYTPVLPCLFVWAIHNLSLGVKRCGHTNHKHSLILLYLIPPLCDKMQWGLWYIPLPLHKNCQSFYTHNALINNSLVCSNATLLHSQNSLLPKEEGSYTHT